jgi:YHS domain-containing protein
MGNDLVCGMHVADDNSNRFFSDYGGEMYYFCSPDCKRKFDDHPDDYIRAEHQRTSAG